MTTFLAMRQAQGAVGPFEEWLVLMTREALEQCHEEIQNSVGTRHG